MADALGLMANICQVVDLLIKVGVMCSIYCMDVKNAPQDARRILKEADRLSVTLKDLERLLNGPNGAKLESSPNLQQTVFECRKLLSECVAKLDFGVKFTRAVWPFKKKDVNHMIASLERHKATITLDLNIEQTVVLLDMHQQSVLSKLRIAEKATYDSSMDGDESRCLPGTRVDIIERIQHWSISEKSEPIFWLNGMAGTGKSTISRTIAQSFADRGILGASFFFKRGEGDRGRAAFFFTTIAAQLVRQLPALAPHIRDTLDADPNIHEKTLSSQFEKLILEPLKKTSPRWQASDLLVVVDALDECDREENMRILIGVLSRARELRQPRLKFFVTSRPELPIRLGFEELGGDYKDLILAQVPKSSIEHDIRLFISHQLQVIKTDYNMSVTANRKLPQDWPGDENTERLIEMAVPLFIVAATMCRFLKDRRLGGPQNQLSGILEYGKMRTSGLDMTYLPILNRLLTGLSESESGQVINKFKYYIGSIVTLSNPLSVGALSRLLDVPEESLEDQLDLLHSVLSVPSDTTTPIRLLHLSFRDFLVNPEGKSNRSKYPFWLDESKSHLTLFKQCLKLLSSDGILKKDMCSLGLPGTMRSDISQETIDGFIAPEVQYSCVYWFHHLKYSGARICDDDCTSRFLNTHLLHWLETLSILGRISESRHIIDGLLETLDTSNSFIVSGFLRDAKRIVLMNMPILDKAPLQIYSSALLFAPQKSIVRSNFLHDLPPWISSLPNTRSDWDTCLTTLEIPGRNIKSLTISNNNKRLASISCDRDCLIDHLDMWDMDNTVCLFTYSPASSMEFSPDSTTFIILPQYKDMKIWDSTTGQCMTTLLGHEGSIWASKFSPDGTKIITGSYDKSVRIWDTHNGDCLAVYNCNSGGICCVEFSPDGRKAIVAYKTFIQIWDITNGHSIAKYCDYDHTISSFSVSPDGQSVASIFEDGTVIYRNLLAAHCVAPLATYLVNMTCFVDNYRLLCLVDRDIIGMFDVSSGACLRRFAGHESFINAIELSPDKTTFASVSSDKTIKLWDLNSGECLLTLRGHELSVMAIRFALSGSTLVSASDDSSIKMWDLTLRDNSESLNGHDSTVVEVIISPNRDRIITVSGGWVLKIWDNVTNKCLVTEDAHMAFGWIPLMVPIFIKTGPLDYVLSQNPLKSWPKSILFLRDGRTFASATNLTAGCTLRLWDAESGCYSLFDAKNRGIINSMTLSPDGNMLATTTKDGFVEIRNVSSKNSVITIRHHDYGIWPAAFSPDSRMIVSACDDAVIRVWDVSTGNCVWSVVNDTDRNSRMLRATFSTSGHLIASYEHDLSNYRSFVRIWDFTTRTCVTECRNKGGGVVQFFFSPSDRHILAVFETGDTCLAIWDARTGECIAEPKICGLLNHISSYSDIEGRLVTNIGTFEIIIPDMPNGSSTVMVEGSMDTTSRKPVMEVIHKGISLSIDASWVTWNSHKMLWLPPAYRASAVDVFDSTITIGSGSGAVFSITIDPSMAPT